MNRAGNLVSGFLPRSVSLVVALLFIGFALRGAFQEDIAVGNMEGVAVSEETQRPIPHADVYISNGLGTSFRSRTDAQGRFHFSSIPVGSYYLEIRGKHHASANLNVSLWEGEKQFVTAAMKHSQPELEVLQHSRVFTSRKKAFLHIQGYIDPKAPNAKDQFHLRLYRTRVSQVLKSEQRIEQFRSYAWGQNAKEGTIPDDFLSVKDIAKPTLTMDKNVSISGDDIEGFFYQQVSLETLAQGFYLLDIQHKGRSVWSWIMVTDTAVVMKRHSRHILAYAVDMETGKPRQNMTVTPFLREKPMASQVTNADGVAEFHLPLPLRTKRASGGDEEGEDDDFEYNSASLWLVAQSGMDEAIISERYFQESRDNYRVHLYTDRTIYRPGQHIAFKGIARLLKPGYVDESLPVPQGEDQKHPYTIPANTPVTVTVRTPNGEKIYTQSLTTNDYGAFHGGLDLEADAQTGVYTLLTKIKGETFTHDVVIASYQKPEFTVNVAPEKPYYVVGDTIEMNVSGEFYFGAPMVGTPIKYSVYKIGDWAEDLPDAEETSVQAMPRFLKSYEYGENEDIEGEARLDANGKAKIRIPTTKDRADNQVQRYTVNVTLNDGKQRNMTLEGSVRVYAGEVHLTVEPDGYLGTAGAPKSITVRARDLTGKPVPNLPITLEGAYEWYDQEKGVPQSKRATTLRGQTDAQGKLLIPYTPTHRGDLTLSAIASDAKGRVVKGRASLWVIGKEESGQPERDIDTMAIYTDKRHYTPGENATVQINTEHIGQSLLVTIEGDRLYSHQIVPVTSKNTRLTLPVRAAYGNNVSIVACYVHEQKIAKSEESLTIRQPEQVIKVQISPDRTPQGTTRLARYTPGEQIKYQVLTTDKQGKPIPCEFSLAVVDESLFALREDSPSAILDNFYPQTYNRVQTTTSFSVEYLGDADKAEPKMTARKRFPDTLYWSPTLQTDAQGKATLTVPLQDTLTTWRATVIAHSKNTEVGWGTCKLLTSKDFLLRVQNPRFLTQNDRSQITAIVHNETKNPMTALVRLKADSLKIQEETTRRIELAPGAQQMIDWNVEASRAGDAPIRVTAWTLNSTPQYTDGVELNLPVQPVGREEVVRLAGDFAPTKPGVEVVRFDPRSAPQYSRIHVRLSPGVLPSILASLPYLIEYPYGCVEQTTSRFLGDLYVQRLLKGRLLGTVPRANEIPKMVKKGILRLEQMQNRDTGLWGWWHFDKPDAWMTGYALIGLAMAKEAGFSVPDHLISRAGEESKKLSTTKDSDAGSMALLYYALTLWGEDVSGLRASLVKNNLSTEALTYIAVADIHRGEKHPELLTIIGKRAKRVEGMTYWEGGETGFESDLSTSAGVLRLLLLQNPQDPRIPSILHWIMRQRTDNYWQSTRDTVAVLAALCEYLKRFPDTMQAGQITVRLNGQTLQTLNASALDRQKDTVIPVPLSRLRPDKNDLVLTTTGNNLPFFYSIESRQFISTPDLPALFPKGYRIVREYRRLVPRTNRNHITTMEAEPTNNQLQAGENVRVRLTLYLPERLDHVLIEDPYPAGCTVSERGSLDEVVEGWGYWWSSIDVRDRKIAFFANDTRAGTHIIEYNLKAQTPGTYNLLPTILQPMYKPHLRVENAIDRITVR
jgi:uncharacterized protein YfaS (alpha-2-macroglobulin family)